MNTFKVDGLTRALARQPKNIIFYMFSCGFVGFRSVLQFFLGFSIKIGNFLLAFLGATRGAKCPRSKNDKSCTRMRKVRRTKLCCELNHEWVNLEWALVVVSVVLMVVSVYQPKYTRVAKQYYLTRFYSFSGFVSYIVFLMFSYDFLSFFHQKPSKTLPKQSRTPPKIPLQNSLKRQPNRLFSYPGVMAKPSLNGKAITETTNRELAPAPPTHSGDTHWGFTSRQKLRQRTYQDDRRLKEIMLVISRLHEAEFTRYQGRMASTSLPGLFKLARTLKTVSDQICRLDRVTRLKNLAKCSKKLF